MKKEGSGIPREIFCGCCFPPAVGNSESIGCVLRKSSGNTTFMFSPGIHVCSLVLEECELRVEKRRKFQKNANWGPEKNKKWWS